MNYASQIALYSHLRAFAEILFDRVSMYRRYEGNRQFFREVGDDGMGRKKFRTSGNAVVVLTALSIAAYASLIALTLRLQE
jgi:hypothetical protein